jgi:hypothetical protein
MPVESRDLWKRQFPNPWKELLPKKESLTLREIVAALRWGAEIDALSPEVRSALEDVYTATTSQSRMTLE